MCSHVAFLKRTRSAIIVFPHLKKQILVTTSIFNWSACLTLRCLLQLEIQWPILIQSSVPWVLELLYLLDIRTRYSLASKQVWQTGQNFSWMHTIHLQWYLINTKMLGYAPMEERTWLEYLQRQKMVTRIQTLKKQISLKMINLNRQLSIFRPTHREGNLQQCIFLTN